MPGTNPVGGDPAAWYDRLGRRTKARVQVDGATNMDGVCTFKSLSLSRESPPPDRAAKTERPVVRPDASAAVTAVQKEAR